MRVLLVFSLAMLLTSCASTRLADEPADLVAPGREMPDLLRMGWEISDPIPPTQAGLPRVDWGGESWTSFVAKLAPRDELRPVRNNAGIGYAIFRRGVLVDMFLTTIF